MSGRRRRFARALKKRARKVRRAEWARVAEQVRRDMRAVFRGPFLGCITGLLLPLDSLDAFLLFGDPWGDRG